MGRYTTAQLATSRRRDGLRLFCERLRDDVSLDLRLDVELLGARFSSSSAYIRVISDASISRITLTKSGGPNQLKSCG